MMNDYIRGFAALQTAYTVLKEILEAHLLEEKFGGMTYTDKEKLVLAINCLQNVAAEEWSADLE